MIAWQQWESIRCRSREQRVGWQSSICREWVADVFEYVASVVAQVGRQFFVDAGLIWDEVDLDYDIVLSGRHDVCSNHLPKVNEDLVDRPANFLLIPSLNPGDLLSSG